MLSSAGSTQLCLNSSGQISVCSSSLRYKNNIAPFLSGLSFIKELQPITFEWKQGGLKDVGFGAEDIARVNSLFVTYNSEGAVEGVKYDRFSAVFVNAFKEQQAQIEHLQSELEQQRALLKQQQSQIDSMKKLICLDHSNADVCRVP